MDKTAIPPGQSIRTLNAPFSPPAAFRTTGNRLLASLSEPDYRKLQAHLEPVLLQPGKDLYDPGDRMTHVFFPTEGIVSLLNELKDGTSAEVAVTGTEGLVGISLFLEGAETTTTPQRAVVQCTGHAYRLRGDFLKSSFEKGGELQQLLLRYTQAFITQVAQTAICIRFHTVEKHLCRLMLLSLDRLPGNEMQLTQSQIAYRLGVRREGIAEAAGHLQSAGIIEFRRGHITVLNRLKLEQRVCECYSLIKKEYIRLLANRPSGQAG